MTIKEITLLSEEEYVKYRSIISNIDCHWWLKTPCLEFDDYVRVVRFSGNPSSRLCSDGSGGVRPALKVIVDSSDPAFWHKSEKLIGSKIELNKYTWTVLNVECDALYILCDSIIAEHYFDPEVNIWEESKLKQWLENWVKSTKR